MNTDARQAESMSFGQIIMLIGAVVLLFQCVFWLKDGTWSTFNLRTVWDWLGLSALDIGIDFIGLQLLVDQVGQYGGSIPIWLVIVGFGAIVHQAEKAGAS